MTKKTTKQLIANPAWRSKVSDKDLKKANPGLYQKRLTARRIKEENATLYNPSALLSGSSLRSAVKGLVDADTKPQMAEYDRAIADTGARTAARQATSNAQYDAQQGSLAAAAGAAQQNTARAVGLQADVQNRNVAAVGTQGQQAQDYVGQLAKNIGVDIGSTGQVAAQTAELQQQATAQGAIRQGQAAQVGAGYEALLQAMAGASTMQKGEASTRLGLKGQSDVSELSGKRSDVVASRGPLATKYLTQLRQTMFTNEAAAKEFGLDVTKAKLDAKTDAARTKILQGQLNVSQQSANTRDRKADADIAKGLAQVKISQQNADTNKRNSEKGVGANGKDEFGNTVIQRRGNTDAFTKARTVARTYKDSFKDQGELYEFLVSSEGLNSTMARAAAQQVMLGYVGPKTYKELQSRGVAGGYNKKKPLRTSPPSPPRDKNRPG